MLKLLLNANIDISSNLKALMYKAILMHNLEMVKFIVEMYPDHDLNNNQYLNECCETNNKDALVYLLKCGANVHMIAQDSIKETHIDIIKILIDNNYVLSQSTLKYLLTNNYVYNLDNIIYMVKIGAEIKWIFDNEKERLTLQNLDYNAVYSTLECMITEGLIDHIKFFAENYLDLLRPEVNRLFVIACANGRNDIASYLYELGAELNDKALISACFFGHHDTVIMLLKFGMNFSSVNFTSAITKNKYNLFAITTNGYYNKGWKNETYDDLINNDITFRNDNYNYGEASEYVDIVKLLIR